MDITLNIHYTIPKELWDKIDPYLTELQQHGIYCSVEPGGLQLFEETEDMSADDFDRYISDFCEKASELLGFPVGDACGDFPCVPFK